MICYAFATHLLRIPGAIIVSDASVTPDRSGERLDGAIIIVGDRVEPFVLGHDLHVLWSKVSRWSR
jgi:hypothetical protein